MFISVLLHGAAFYISAHLARRAAEEEMYHIRFVAPPPILKKSFELAKRPELSEVQMEFILAQAEAPQLANVVVATDVSALGADIMGAISPTMREVMGAYSGAKPSELRLETAQVVDVTGGSPTLTQEAINLKTELLSVKDLDIGRYKAIVIPDPTDKKNIRGFFKMTLVTYKFQDPDVDTYPMAIPNLIRYINDHTKLRASIEGTKIELSDPKLFEAPFIYMTGYTAVMDLSETEIENLGEYLRNGGFLFCDDIAPQIPPSGSEKEWKPNPQRGLRGTAFDSQMRAVLKRALGAEAKFFRIPNDHPLFHSFYDFDDGPPLGGATGGNVNYLEGINIRGRLAVVFSDLNISWYWGDPCPEAQAGRERGLQFGVNLVVYALTQPGGIANISQYTMR